jgi:hypothetical protein
MLAVNELLGLKTLGFSGRIYSHVSFYVSKAQISLKSFTGSPLSLEGP